MNRCFEVIFLLLLSVTSLSCQNTDKRPPQANVFSVPDLGLRYTPPAGMTDATSPAGKEARIHAAAHTSNTTELILDMTSDDADTAPDWHQVWIFTYPRVQLSNLTDSAAETKINTSLAGPRSTAVGQPRSDVLFGSRFCDLRIRTAGSSVSQTCEDLHDDLQRSTRLIRPCFQFRGAGKGHGRKLKKSGFFQPLN